MIRDFPKAGPSDVRGADHLLKAYSQETGEVLWEVNLGSPVTGYPITYAVDGTQYVAVSTGISATTSSFLRLTPEPLLSHKLG